VSFRVHFTAVPRLRPFMFNDNKNTDNDDNNSNNSTNNGGGRVSSVGIAIGYGLDGLGIESR
jgi:hypothetical protein